VGGSPLGSRTNFVVLYEVMSCLHLCWWFLVQNGNPLFEARHVNHFEKIVSMIEEHLRSLKILHWEEKGSYTCSLIIQGSYAPWWLTLGFALMAPRTEVLSLCFFFPPSWDVLFNEVCQGFIIKSCPYKFLCILKLQSNQQCYMTQNPMCNLMWWLVWVWWKGDGRQTLNLENM